MTSVTTKSFTYILSRNLFCWTPHFMFKVICLYLNKFYFLTQCFSFLLLVYFFGNFCISTYSCILTFIFAFLLSECLSLKSKSSKMSFSMLCTMLCVWFYDKTLLCPNDVTVYMYIDNLAIGASFKQRKFCFYSPQERWVE